MHIRWAMVHSVASWQITSFQYYALTKMHGCRERIKRSRFFCKGALFAMGLACNIIDMSGPATIDATGHECDLTPEYLLDDWWAERNNGSLVGSLVDQGFEDVYQDMYEE